MIYKQLSRTSPGYSSLLDYLQREGAGRNGGKPLIITHNIIGNEREDILRAFMENESFRKHPRRDQVYLYHTVIAFGKDATVSREQLEDIARHYFTLRGESGMYVAALHEDKHAHIHVMESALHLYTGMSMRMSKEEMAELKVSLQDYHLTKYPDITDSYVSHGSGGEYLKDSEYFMKKRQNDRTLIKETIGKQLQEIYKDSTNQTDFLSRLRDAGFHHYERGSTPTGVEVDGYKFRFSRLDIPIDMLPEQSPEKLEEDKILDEIRQIRETRSLGREIDTDRNSLIM